MQIVFQDPYRSLNPRRTVADSMIEAERQFRRDDGRRDEARRRIARSRSFAATVARPFPPVSGGQRQRICIARADAAAGSADRRRAVSALDVSVQAQVPKLFDEIREKFSLALFITHDLRVAAQICDRIVVMQKGRRRRAGRDEGSSPTRSMPTKARLRRARHPTSARRSWAEGRCGSPRS